MTFSHAHIVVTAVVCSGAAGAVLALRGRHDAVRTVSLTAIIILVLGLGLSVVALRELSNVWRLNDDFAPAISIADVGSGFIPWVLLLALTSAPSAPRLGWCRWGGPRSWLATSTVVAFTLFVCNVVLI